MAQPLPYWRVHACRYCACRRSWHPPEISQRLAPAQRFDSQGRSLMRGSDFHAKVQAAREILIARPQVFVFRCTWSELPSMKFGLQTRTTKSARPQSDGDRKSTRLNSSHLGISYAVFCLK